MIEIKNIDLVDNNTRISNLLDAQRSEHFFIEVQNQSFSYALYEDGLYQGGITGNIHAKELHISLLALHTTSRGKGYGQKLIQVVEDFALHNDCHTLTVTTQSFQAKPFYEKQGFQVFGQLEDVPFAGTTRYYLVKRLKNQKNK